MRLPRLSVVAALLGWLCVAVFALPVLAQPAANAGTAGPDYAVWTETAQTATQFLEDKSGADTDLVALRVEIQRFRDAFLAQQGANTAQITTLKEQIAALGPAPEGDAVETAEVAARRKSLHDELAKAQEPVVKAVEAQAQADAMLRALADLDRERQAGRVLSLSPSPLSPSGWSDLAVEGRSLVGNLATEVQERVSVQEPGWFLSRLLAASTGIVMGLVVLLGGARVVRRTARRLVARFPFRIQAVAGFVVSLFQVVLPIVGLHVLLRGFAELGILGPWWQGVLQAFSGSFATAVVGYWIVRVFFESDRTHTDYINPARRLARGYAFGLVLVFAAYRFVSQTGSLRVGMESVFLGPVVDLPERLGEAASGAAILPLLCLAAVGLWGFDRLRAGAVRSVPADEEEDAPAQSPYRVRMLSGLSAVAKYAGLVGVVLAMLGYVALGNYVVWSSVLMLGSALFLLTLHDFATSAWSAITGRSAEQGLAPVVTGFVLIACFAPLFALSWGARPSSLWETATLLGRGFPVGDVTLSPRLVVVFLITLVVGTLITRVVKGVFKTTVLPRTRLDSGAQSAAVAGIGYLGIFLAVLVAVMSAGIDLSSLAIVAGALSVGIGFGLQNIISNFVSGIILLIERPISVGDWIDAGGKQGTVRSVSVRSTRIRTFDNTEVIVPNSDLISNSVTNWTRGSTIGRVIVPVTVAFGTDTERVEAILMEISQRYEEVLPLPAAQVYFAAFAANGYTLELRAFLRDIRDHIRVSTLMRHAIVKEFAKEGIVIPPMVQEIRVVGPDAGPSSPPLGSVSLAKDGDQ